MSHRSTAGPPSYYHPQGYSRSKEWRVVLVGKTGAGKSSSGNTILEREAFDAELTLTSVTSECKKEMGVVGGRSIAVIDTPGLFDTTLSNEDVMKRIKMCIGMSSPGPHAFLLIIQLGRFTEEEEQTVKMIQEAFGEKASRYILVLFTHGDRLKRQTIEDFLSKSEKPRELVSKCNNRYHVFNNNSTDPSQTTQLMEKIHKMVEENGGSHYTTSMFLEVEKAAEAEKARILKENEAQRNKVLEELKKSFSGELLKLQQEILKQRYECQARLERLEGK